MTITLTVAVWWTVPIFLTLFCFWLALETRDTSEVFGLWAMLMLVVFFTRVLP